MNKTLVILSPGFPAAETDINCLPMQQAFVRTLNKIYPALEIIILSFHYPFAPKKYRWYGNTVISFGGRSRGGLARLWLQLQINKSLNDICRTKKILALLSCWCGECAITGKRFAGKFGLKHYCWILGQDARKSNHLVRRIKPLPDELIALSDFLQEEFDRNHGIRPAHVIPPGIAEDGDSRKILVRDIDLLGVGSLIPLKQYDIFMEMVYELKKHIPGIKSVLCGNGPEETRLQQLRSRLGLNDHVRMTGEISYHEALLLMQRSKILLHPSSYEGFSGVCMEALHHGARVISFCRAMKKEVANWHIVSSKEEMKNKILDILQHPNESVKNEAGFFMNDSVNRMMGLFNT